MKILHALTNYHPSIGGTQIFYKNISEKCITNFGDEVIVYASDSYYAPHNSNYKKINIKKEIINEVYIQRFPFYHWHVLPAKKAIRICEKLFNRVPAILYKYLAGPWSSSFKDALDTTDADIISGSPFGYLHMDYPLYRHKLNNPKPFVFQGALHFSNDNSGKILPPAMLNAIKHSEYYVANTEYEKKNLGQLGVDEKNIVVIGSAVNMDMYTMKNCDSFQKKNNIIDNDKVVAYIGRIASSKSIEILIKAFKKIAQSDIKLKLIIAGFDSNYSHVLKIFVEKNFNDIKNRIFFFIGLSDEEKVHLYHSIDVLVLPSKEESFGMVFLEAWSCRKPVIGVNIGAIRSVISNENDGLLFEPENVDDLAHKILRLLGDKNMRDKFGENGYNKTAKNYTWPVVTKKYREVYQNAIDKFKKRS